MCNARNHPPNCRSGFGSEGHAGRTSPRVGSHCFRRVPRILDAYENYVNPKVVAHKIVRVYRRAMTGRQFIARVRRWARVRSLEVRFVASEGPGSHGTLYAGGRKTTVKDRKKEIGRGLLRKMLADLGIDPNEL